MVTLGSNQNIINFCNLIYINFLINFGYFINFILYTNIKLGLIFVVGVVIKMLNF